MLAIQVLDVYNMCSVALEMFLVGTFLEKK